MQDAKRQTNNAQGKEPKEAPSKVTYTGRKDSDIFKAGQIDAKTSMDSWLRSQPDWFIESALGKTRVLNYSKMVDCRLINSRT